MKQSQYRIAQALLALKEPITVSRLAEQLEMKERSLRYDLDQLYYELRKYQIILASKAGTGIWLEHSDKLNLEDTKRRMAADTADDITTPKDRQAYMIRRLLETEQGIKLSSFEDELKISHNTAVADLKKITEWFSEQGVEVNSRKGTGIILMADEVKLRNAVSRFYKDYYQNDLLDYLEHADSIIPGFDEQDIYDVRWVKSLVEEYEKRTGVSFAENSKIALTWHIVLTVKRLHENQVIELDEQKLADLRKEPEFQEAREMAAKIGRRYKLDLPESEIGYITLHLVGMGRQGKGNQPDELYIQKEEIIELLNRLSILLQCDFTEDQELIRNLAIHLEPAIVRAKHQICLENPLLPQIKTNYSRIFNAVKKSLAFLEEEKGIHFSDDEIGFISLHVASIFEKKRERDKNGINVVVVCGTGAATSEMLRARLEVEFPEFNIIDTLSSLRLNEYDLKGIGLIISTIPITEDLGVRAVMVSPLLLKKDIDNLRLIIQGQKIAEASGANVEAEDIIKVVRNYATINDYSLLEQSINQLLEVKSEKGYLFGLLAKSRISYEETPREWHQALMETNRLLENEGYVNEDYGRRVIELAVKYKDYFIIGEGVAIAHATAESDVKKTGLSLLVSKQGIDVENRGRVHWLFELASIHEKIHYRAINQIMEMTRNKALDIKKINSLEDICDLFERCRHD